MKLYHWKNAPNPRRVRIFLAEKGVSVPMEDVGQGFGLRPDYVRRYARAMVPMLELDDGTRITESNVILQYLADRRPGTLAPAFGTLERYKLMEWLAFIATEVHKGFGPLWNPQVEPAVRERTIAALGNRFGYISKTLAAQPYLTGNAFTIADAYLFVVLNWTGYHKVDLKPWPALTEFQARVAARPAVQATLKAEGLGK